MSDKKCTCTSCADRAGNSGSPYSFFNFNTRSVDFKLTGAQIDALVIAQGQPSGTASFPVMIKVAEIDLETSAALMAVNLASSILNYGATSVASVSACLIQSPLMSLRGINRVFTTHMAQQNSVVGLPAPATRTTSVSMGQSSAFRINSGEKVGIYVSAPIDALTELSGVLTIYWNPVS